METTTLRFLGDWPWYAGLGLAFALAALAFWLYRRETRHSAGLTAWALPALRALAIFLVVCVLTGPVLHHEKVQRQLGRLFIFLDASRSMDMTDDSMPVARKVTLLANYGMLPKDPVLTAADESQRQFQTTRNLAAKVNRGDTTNLDFGKLIGEYDEALRLARENLARVQAELAPVNSGADDQKQKEADKQAAQKLREKIDEPLKRLVERVRNTDFKDKINAAEAWTKIATEVAVLEQELVEKVGQYVNKRLTSNSEGAQEFRQALARFDKFTRWDRAQETLLAPDKGLVDQITAEQDLEILSLRERETENLYYKRANGSQTSGPVPARLIAIPDSKQTNLATVVRDALGSETQGAAVLLLTDGQHNMPGSPEETSRLLGGMGVPVFSIGYGSDLPIPDIGILDVTGPQTVQPEGVVRGDVVLNDFLPAGAPYKVRIMNGEDQVWEKDIKSEGSGERRIPYDFQVKPLIDKARQKGGANEAKTRAIPLALKAVVEPPGGLKAAENERKNNPASTGEKILTNNEHTYFVQAVTRKRKILIVDGRPRWETRYLANLFERDEQWSANVLMQVVGEGDGTQQWTRGKEVGQFPATREDLFTYDLIILGDVPLSAFQGEESEWLADYVEKRGGGVILLDGQRGNLSKWEGNKIATLSPVKWLAPGPAQTNPETMPKRLFPSGVAEKNAAFQLVSDVAENEKVWNELQAPHWVADVEPLPGTLVMIQAERKDGRNVPAMVARQFGAGRVLYIGCDELWRWRYKVTDRYHGRFWNQMANFIGEPPFSVVGDYVSLASDKSVYQEDEDAELRVRFRDKEGKYVQDAKLSAILYRDGKPYSDMEMEGDPNNAGLYRAKTGKLPAGKYEVAVSERGTIRQGPEFDSRMEFQVTAMSDLETTRLSMNRELLQKMAAESGGRFFQEEEAGQLKNLLETMDRKQVFQGDTVLWSSYWWFIPIILLLTLEWIMRKRAGWV